MALGLLISIVKLAAEFGWLATDLLSVLFCKPAAGCLTGVDGISSTDSRSIPRHHSAVSALPPTEADGPAVLAPGVSWVCSGLQALPHLIPQQAVGFLYPEQLGTICPCFTFKTGLLSVHSSFCANFLLVHLFDQVFTGGLSTFVLLF